MMMENNERMTAVQQGEYVALLVKGAAPSAACGSVGVSVAVMLATLEKDRKFRQLVQQVDMVLSQNVAAALYRKAMEGSVPAQTFLLKHRPPPEWQTVRPGELTDKDVEQMTDEELAELLRS
jgi:hypothetical protein